jgi:methyltransferase (TIGR00027 family)
VDTVRTDNDTWDLASSVGATATGVAVGRALASRGPDPMINDPFAEPLVRAVGVDFFTRMASGQLDPAEVDGDAVFGMRRMVDMMGVRTRFFDDFFMQATDAGIRQAVILASGLDARAYRLSWPAGTTVYEIDQPQVIDFKTTTLAKLGASATADRRAVAIDLRHDWPTALRQAGFDPAQPTAWTAEGLLLFLPPEAQDRLLDNVTALSVPGSRFASENMPGSSELVVKMQERMRGVTESWRRYGFDLDMADLGYTGERHEVAEYLNAHGWDTVATSMAEVFAANGLSPHEDDEMADLNARFGYVAATRVGDAGQR